MLHPYLKMSDEIRQREIRNLIGILNGNACLKLILHMVLFVKKMKKALFVFSYTF